MRGVYFTDIHWGRKDNSVEHNADCTAFVDYMIDYINTQGNIDYIAFLGDWNQHRNSINVFTMHVSHEAAKKLNRLELPVYFIVGNHDLYHRNNREYFSTVTYDSLDNFVVIDKPKVINQCGCDILFSPYLFDAEYPILYEKYQHVPVWAGHFEFKSFILTGQYTKSVHGADPDSFSNIKRIFSGHFHKRQHSKNITYIGNTFPMDLSDAGDSERGFMVYDHDADEMTFIDWLDGPFYDRVPASVAMDPTFVPKKNSVIVITDDVKLQHQQIQQIKEKLSATGNIRGLKVDFQKKLIMEDNEQNENMLKEGDKTIDDIVIDKLSQLMSVDTTLLINMYRELMLHSQEI